MTAPFSARPRSIAALFPALVGTDV
jgi:hypothetical protein